ncbi:unnamed protein product [Dibothriocephalus latus]|uniref:Diphthine--ammonia ligase n=1 Tax=Dibothriocephalus latus TaxID=60516 RepID=A0A3P7PT34_DIBLA|nr:unnamed protein product [Dibothriocephalus latus]
MKLAALVSGGKDSCFAICESIVHGHEIVALVNLKPCDTEASQVEIDSYMFQSVATEGIRYFADALEVPLFQANITGTAVCQSLSYHQSPADEVGADKDAGKLESYRPICLTSVVRKVCERMVERRLRHWVEENQKLVDYQDSFRKTRSTEDQLIRLSQSVSDGFHIKPYRRVALALIDFEKAYDTVDGIGEDVEISLSADDAAVCSQDTNSDRAIQRVQTAITMIFQWSRK